MTAEHEQALPVGTRLGDYRLDAVIGHGGFGITYRAFDTQLAKFVACVGPLRAIEHVRSCTPPVPRRERLKLAGAPGPVGIPSQRTQDRDALRSDLKPTPAQEVSGVLMHGVR